MKGRFLHIYLQPNTGVTDSQVEAKMNLALDWFSYDENVWVVYSTADMTKWKSRLAPIAGDSGRYFVCEADPTKERVGWMSKSLWKWLGKDR